jgi:hypothetical protein
MRAGRAVFDNACVIRRIDRCGRPGIQGAAPAGKAAHWLACHGQDLYQTSDQLSTVAERMIILCIPSTGARFAGPSYRQPACFMATGLLQSALVWVSGGLEFKVVQTTAHSCGDEVCNFTILKTPLSRHSLCSMEEPKPSL